MSEEFKLDPEFLEKCRDKDLSPEEHAAFQEEYARPVALAKDWEQQMNDSRVRWKYRVRQMYTTDLQVELNAFGRMGWEIAHIEPHRSPTGSYTDKLMVVFKASYRFEQLEETHE